LFHVQNCEKRLVNQSGRLTKRFRTLNRNNDHVQHMPVQVIDVEVMVPSKENAKLEIERNDEPSNASSGQSSNSVDKTASFRKLSRKCSNSFRTLKKRGRSFRNRREPANNEYFDAVTN
jgi:hypothetical protein